MRHTNSTKISSIALTFAMATCLASVGCQSALNGQTLPSPSYFQDDIQYFPSGPEFKLPAEATALKAAREAEMAEKK